MENFGEDIDFWATFNEPISIYVGYARGFFAPGLTDEEYARQSLHNLLVCHGETVKLFRSMEFRKSKIGIVMDVWKHYPARPGNKEDEECCIFNNEIEGYGMFLNPLFLGKYSDAYMSYMESRDMVPHMEEGDMECIHQKLDFYGLNFYNGLIDHAEEIREKEKKEIIRIGQSRIQKSCMMSFICL